MRRSGAVGMVVGKGGMESKEEKGEDPMGESTREGDIVVGSKNAV